MLLRPLRFLLPIGWIGVKYEHVEPHALDVGQALDHVVEGAVPPGIAALRAREQLVPGGEFGGRPVDQDLELGLVARGVGADPGVAHQPAHVLAEHGLQQPPVVVLERRQLLDQPAERPLVGALGLLVGALDQRPALAQLEADVEPGVVLLHDLAAPALEQIAPRLDGVEVTGVALERKPPAPAVVVEERHRRLAPLGLVLRAVLDRRRDLVVTVAEDVGLDLDHVAHHPLDRMAATVELRLDALDHDAVGGELQKALLARLRGGLGEPRRHLARGQRLAAEHAQLQRLERDRLAGLEGRRRNVGRDILELADPPADLAEQRPGIDPPGAPGVRVDQGDRGIVGGRQIAAREAQKPDHRRVRRGDLLLPALDVERRRRRLHAVDLGDEAGEVDARLRGLPGPVAGSARDHVHPGAAAVLVAHRQQHAAREGRGEQIAQPVLALELGRLGIAELDRQALGVVILGEGDGRRDLAVEVVLLEQPGGAEVPPLGAVEEVVEARVLQAQHLLRRAAEGLGEEAAIRRGLLRLLDQGPPDLRRHLIGGIAAEPAETELQVVLDQVHPVFDHRRARIRVVVVELGEITPDRELARVDRIDRARRAQLAVAIAPEPFRMLLHQDRILGGVVDHQVHHHRDIALGRGLGEIAQERLRVASVGQQRVEAVKVLDRIEAAREPG